MSKQTRRLLTNIGLHLALLAGSVLFAFPFVWLVTTTFKGDEEIFSEHVNWIPTIPWYSPKSPYIDQRAYNPMRRPASMTPNEWRQLKPKVESAFWQRAHEIARELGLSIPATAAEQMVRGLWQQVKDTLPQEVLRGDPAAAADAAKRAVSPDVVTAVWNRVHKQLAIGKLRVLDAANRDIVLRSREVGGGSDVGWQVSNGHLADQPRELGGEKGRIIEYTDTAGGVRLSAEVAVSGRPERISLVLHDDQSWRHVNLSLLTSDGAFRSKHPFVMANGEWQDITWTFRPPRDRRSREIVVAPIRTENPLPAAGRLNLTVTIEPTSPWRAIFDKYARNYREAIRYVPFWTFTKNSVYLVILNILGQVFACSLVAYAFARLRWPGRDILFVILLSTMMLPPQVTMVPVFLIIRKLQWYNTLKPLWLPSFFGSAFFIFLLRQFFMTIPRDLEDAAKIDGCSYAGLYWRIMLPLVKPALAAVAIFQFLGSWNDFMGPLIYINDLRLTPLSLGLFQFQQEHSAEWGMLMAGSLLMTLPAILIFFFAQKYFIQGVTLTGLKG